MRVCVCVCCVCEIGHSGNYSRQLPGHPGSVPRPQAASTLWWTHLCTNTNLHTYKVIPHPHAIIISGLMTKFVPLLSESPLSLGKLCLYPQWLMQRWDAPATDQSRKSWGKTLIFKLKTNVGTSEVLLFKTTISPWTFSFHSPFTKEDDPAVLSATYENMNGSWLVWKTFRVKTNEAAMLLVFAKVGFPGRLVWSHHHAPYADSTFPQQYVSLRSHLHNCPILRWHSLAGCTCHHQAVRQLWMSG